MERWLFVWIACFVLIGLVYELICLLLPSWFTYHHLLGKCFLWLVVANFVFEMTREKIFKRRVQPGNKAVFISGCDSGFGYHTAKQLDSTGFHVFAGCLFPTQGGATELKKDCSDRLHLVHADVTKNESIQKAKDYIQKNIGSNDLWAIVNNAGIYKGFDVEFSKLSDFTDAFEVNTLGQVRTVKTFLPLLKRSKGRIVNASHLPTAHMAAYAMSKHASYAFTECLRQELEAWGIQVVSVEPEFVKTPMSSNGNMMKYLSAIFQSLDSDVRAEYGEEYMERVKTMMKKMFGIISSPNVETVVAAIVSAISVRHPSVVYRPCGNITRRIMYYMVYHMHTFMLDALLKVYFVFWKVPKPKAAISL